MMDRYRSRPSSQCPTPGAATALASVLGLTVTLWEVCHFKQQAEFDGGGMRAWTTLLVALGGVMALLYDTAMSPENLGSGSIKLMAALMVAHVFVPLLVSAPTPNDGDDD